MTALYVIANQYLALAEKLADGDFDAATIADTIEASGCLLYTSDAADEEDSVDLGGRRIIKKKKKFF